MFGGKVGEKILTEAMTKKFKLVKKPVGYAITIISNPAVKVATHILARKVIRKALSDEVPMLVVALVAQCTEGV